MSPFKKWIADIGMTWVQQRFTQLELADLLSCLTFTQGQKPDQDAEPLMREVVHRSEHYYNEVHYSDRAFRMSKPAQLNSQVEANFVRVC